MRIRLMVLVSLLALRVTVVDSGATFARTPTPKGLEGSIAVDDFSPLAKPGFVTEDSGKALRLSRPDQVWEDEVTLSREVTTGGKDYVLPITLMGRVLVAPDEDTAVEYFLTVPGFRIEMRHQKEGITSSPVLPYVFYASQPNWHHEATLTRMVTIGNLPLVLRVMDKPTFTDYLAAFESYPRRHTRSLRVDHVGDAEQRMIPQALWLQRVQSLLADHEAELQALVGGGDMFIPNAYSDVSTSDDVRAVLTEVARSQGFEKSVIDDSISMAAVPLALNEIGLDAGGIGNHEGDKRSRGLARMVALSRFPWVVSNADFSESDPFDDLVGSDGGEASELGGRVVRWTKIPGAHGQSIGFITLLTPLAAGISKFEGVTIEPETVEVGGERRAVRDEQGIAPVEAVLDELWKSIIHPVVRDMQAEGIDVIVLSDHLQQSLYSRLMMEKSEGVDLWISNGSGNLFWGNRELPLNQGLEIADIYPAWRESRSGEPVALLAGGDEGVFYSMFLGEVDALGRLLPHRTHPMTGPWPATRQGVENLEQMTRRRAATSPRLEKLVGALQGAVERLDSVSLIHTEKFLRGGAMARGSEKYPLQDLMADALLHAAATDYDLRYDDGRRRVPRLSIINDGGNRYSLGSYLDARGRESFGFGTEVPVLGRWGEDGSLVREPGWVSPLHVSRVFSFDDSVVVVDLKASDLVAWFGWGVGRLDPVSMVHPGEFLHTSGAVYGFDEERPSPWTRDDVEPGARITYLSVWDPVAGSWEKVVETDANGERVWRVEQDQLFTVVMRDFTLRRGIEGGTPGDNLPELASMADGTARPVLLSGLPQPEPRLDFLVPAREQLIFCEHLLRLRDMGRKIDDEFLDYRARMESSQGPPQLEAFRFIGFDEPYRVETGPTG